MSYILDALKKSEQQRSSMNLPVETPPLAPQQIPGTSRFILPLTLLAVALAAGWFFVRFQQPLNHQPDPAEKQATASTTHAAETTFAPVQKQTQTMRSRKIDPVIPVAIKPQQTTTASQRAHQAPVTRNKPGTIPVFKPITPASPVSRVASPLPELPDEIALPSPAETSITSFNELPASVRQSLPPIHIEGHIYDDDPAARMVIINGVIRREKQRIDKNLKLEEITPNGVILSHQGHVFHMGVFEQ